MIGARIYPPKESYPYQIEDLLQPGDYAKCEGIYHVLGWMIRAPNGDIGFVRPPVFTITEHEDATITVGPASIQLYDREGKMGWHGYLHKGEWKTA